MYTTHRLVCLAGHRLHRIDFAPATLTPADLLWLPHHTNLAHAARKRQAEHLAGRLAAAHALRELNITAVPGIGLNGEPLWPAGIRGSISHTADCALALVTAQPGTLVGIDCEQILAPQEAQEIKEGIIDADEERLLRAQPLAFAAALTLAFSAKESLFKALFPTVNAMMGFDAARVTAMDENQLTLNLTGPQAAWAQGTPFTLDWRREGERVITLLHGAV